jgi:hypothetical protein
MSLKVGKPNAYNITSTRKLCYMPAHFAKMTLKSKVNLIDSWVYHNLNSRYAIISALSVDSNNKVEVIQELGVEDSKELTILSLMCPHLQNNRA